MPFRLDAQGFDGRAKVQFTTSVGMPHLIYKACLATETVSNTVYVQHAVCEALARDLGIPLDELLNDLPTPRTRAKHLSDRMPSRIGPANTVGEVK